MLEDIEYKKLQEMSEEVHRILNGLIDSMKTVTSGSKNLKLKT